MTVDEIYEFDKDLKKVLRSLIHLEDRVNNIVDNFALDCLSFERFCKENGLELKDGGVFSDVDERLCDS